jgi:4-amino-4-deoxychorismate lyase
MPDTQINQMLDIQERGLHYGDGLFETLLKVNGGIPLWKYHLDRLQRGCDKLALNLPGENWLLDKIETESSGHDSAVIKLIVTRGIGGRGLEIPTAGQASVFVLRYPYTAINQAELEIDVGLCQTRLPINQNLAGLKHLNRLDYVLAAIELGSMDNKNEAILCDSDGYIVEGIISNLFFCLQGEVYTPSLEFAGVEGIMRQQILRHLEDQAIPVQIGRFQPDLLLNASECFLCNSVHGVRPIRCIDDAKYSTGAISQMLIKVFNINGNSTSIVTS